METYKVMGLDLALPQGRANEIEKTFKPFDIACKGYEQEYKNILTLDISEDTCIKAGNLRKKIAKVRTGAEKARKEIKADVLQLSKAIDAVGKLIKESVSEKEEKLKEIETYYERLEAERKEKLKIERLAELEKLNVDGSAFGVENMELKIWESFLDGQKANFEAEKKRKRDEFLAEMKRKQEAEAEQKRIKAENEKMRKEREVQEAILRKEREKREKLEKEQEEKEKKERAEKKAKKIEELAKKQAPDKEKFENYLNDILSLKLPEMESSFYARKLHELYEKIKYMCKNA